MDVWAVTLESLLPRLPRNLLDLWHLGYLNGVRRVNGALEIGAAEPYSGKTAGGSFGDTARRWSKPP